MFWTAENIDEKNVEAGFGETGPASGVGVRGAEETVESLLGPAFEPARRLCDIMFPEGAESARRGLLVVATMTGGGGSVGVGGVFTMMGAGADCVWVCGVCGGALKGSSFGPRERRRLRPLGELGSRAD